MLVYKISSMTASMGFEVVGLTALPIREPIASDNNLNLK